MYAIVDIETTGGKYNQEGITEIAIYRFNGHSIEDQFSSLVNPERKILPFVEVLTGITNKSIKRAPKFYELAKRVIEITSDCVIVAHNAKFDYRMLSVEFKRLGYKYEKKTLCTVLLSKQLIPDLEAYNLGAICKSLGIPIKDRHRAQGDAFATLQLFKLLLNKDKDKGIIKSYISALAPQITSSDHQKLLEKLPTKTGVLYIHDAEGTILYIQESKSMRSDLLKILIREAKNQKFIKKITTVSHDETGSYLIAQILAHQERAIHKPLYSKKKSKTPKEITFPKDSMLLVDDGRTEYENAVFLIENQQFKGYGYSTLNQQMNAKEILQNIIRPMENLKFNRMLIFDFLQQQKFKKIIEL